MLLKQPRITSRTHRESLVEVTTTLPEGVTNPTTNTDNREKEVTVEVTKTSQEGVTCDGY